MYIFLLSFLSLSNFGVYCMPVSDLSNSVFDQASNVVSAAKNLGPNPFGAPVIYRETAKKETEGLGSAVLSVYDNSQQKSVNFLNPKPIVDTIKEHEKYGNNGDNLSGLTSAFVNGYETFSNIVNKIISSPENLIRQIGKTINIPFDNLGARLVGLA